MLDSSAVAVDWADRIVGGWSGSVAVIVSFSMFGSALAGLFSSSRVLMAVAREGRLINQENNTNPFYFIIQRKQEHIDHLRSPDESGVDGCKRG